MTIGITAKENQSIESSESVAASSIEWASDTGGDPLDAASTEKFIEVTVQVSITFNASATGDAVIHARKSADGGTTENTEGTNTEVRRVACSAGNTVTVDVSFYDFTYLDIGVENEDTTYTLSYTAIWRGTYFTGLAIS